MAETYHILDWRALPLTLAATLAAGLRNNSRVKMAEANIPVSAETLFIATCADALKILVWHNTKDGQKGKNPPMMILDSLFADKQRQAGTTGFDTPAAFMAWRSTMIKRGDLNGRNAG